MGDNEVSIVTDPEGGKEKDEEEDDDNEDDEDYPEPLLFMKDLLDHHNDPMPGFGKFLKCRLEVMLNRSVQRETPAW
jgi:hypothetical protein